MKCIHRDCWERFPRYRELAIPTCITAAVPSEVGGGENVPRISRRMHNPKFDVSGKRPMDLFDFPFIRYIKSAVFAAGIHYVK